MDHKDLESRTLVTEQDLDKSRKDFKRAGLILHFGGEFIGMIYYVGLKGLVIPCIRNWSEGNLDFDYKNIATGLMIYAISQVPAFLFKGLSMTPEENRELAEKFKKEAQENKQRGRDIFAWLDKKMAKLHYHFVDNHKKYDTILKGYSDLRKKYINITLGVYKFINSIVMLYG